MNNFLENILSVSRTGVIRWETDPLLKDYSVPTGIYSPFPGAASKHAADMTSGEYASPAMAKALRLFFITRAADESNPDPLAPYGAAIGIDENGKTYAEYRYVLDEDETSVSNADVAIFDPVAKIMKAGICTNENGETTALTNIFDTKKKLNPGVAIILALIPNLMADEEFQEVFYQIEDSLMDPSKADADFYKGIAVLTSNFASRAENRSSNFGLNKGSETSIKVLKTKQIADYVSFADSEYSVGSFRFIGAAGGQSARTMAAKAFNGRFMIGKAIAKDAMVMPDSYLVPQVIIDICQDIKDSTANLVPVRNIMLLGPSGTGKSEGAKAIAAGLGIPYEAYTCHSKTDLFEIFGGYVPNTEASDTDMDVPTPEDMEFDPEGSYEKLTGSKLASGSKTDLHELFALALNKVRKGSSKSRYKFVESATTRAIKADDYRVLEIQELDRIKDAGTITMLNEILCYGKAQLPNGQVVKRGKNTIIVFTANVNYAASRQMDQSIISRCEEVEWIELPTKDELIKRAMARTGCTDKTLVTKMAGKVMEIAKFCDENGISDGSCGFRELISWISTVMLGRSYEKQAVRCVINKCTLSNEDKRAIAVAVFDMEYDDMLSF